ncbi:MacS family sensor histidine kinase [Streptacidiphilus monticola]|uniref:MacS family sensor histidine kinase n=1 Tax=Streptacidiphilus monticola TaxID=2161674 RepID=A0ABW1FXI5_9ACTN
MKGSRGGGGSFSVEQPLWVAVSAFRVLTVLYADARYAGNDVHYDHAALGWGYMAVLTLWTLATLPVFSSKARCDWRWISADLLLVVAGIVLTAVFDSRQFVDAGDVTLPTIRAAASVLGFAVMGGWKPAAFAGLAVGVANVVERGRLTSSNAHNIVLLMLAGVAIGYVVDLARRSEETLARALEIQAATRERERLARDIHDGVLQVLAMVQRRGAELGGEAEEIGRLAGEQEIALRALIAEGLAPNPSYEAPRRRTQVDAPSDPHEPQDVRALLGPLAGSRVTVSAPGTPVLLPRRAATEVAAAVGAALDNVRRHVGERAQAWILVEDEPDAVVVSVRDDGPGFDPARRLGEAEAEGRLGVSQSIRGRLRDLGGSAEIFSAAGQGTEVELRVPKQRLSGEVTK